MGTRVERTSAVSGVGIVIKVGVSIPFFEKVRKASLKLRAKEVPGARLLLKSGPKKRRQVTSIVMHAQIGEFGSPTAADRQSTQFGKGLYEGRFSGAVLSDKEGHGLFELQVEPFNERQCGRVFPILEDGIGSKVHAL